MNKNIFYYLIIIVFLTGCSSDQTKPVSFDDFLKLSFKSTFDFLVLEKKDDIQLPMKKGQIDMRPFFISDDDLYFISRRFNLINQYNSKTRQMKKFSRQELYINTMGYMDNILYINDSKKGRIIRLAKDLTHYQNFLGQINEDSQHNGNKLFLFRNGIFQLNYDLNRIFFYDFNGKMLFDVPSPSPSESIIDISMMGDDFVFFYPGRIFIYNDDGKMINEMKIRYSEYFCDNNGLFLFNDGSFLNYDKNLKLIRKYIMHINNIENIKHASLKLFYYQYGNYIYHMLEDGNSEKVRLPENISIKDYIPVYDNDFLILGQDDSLVLYSHYGIPLKKYIFVDKYYSLILFKDKKGKFYLADSRKQLLKVINEATFSIIKEIINNSAALSKDSNIEVDPAGNIFFVNRSGGNIEKMTYKFQNVQFQEPKGIRRLPYSLFYQIIPLADGGMLLFSKDKQKLFGYSNNKEQLFQLNFSNTRSNKDVIHADWVCANALSEFVVLDISRNSLFFFTKEGDLSKKISLDIVVNNNAQIEFDSMGRLWMISGNMIYCIEFKSEKPNFILKTELSEQGESLQIDKHNNIAILFSEENTLKIRKFSVYNPFNKGMEYYRSHRFKLAIKNFEKAKTFSYDERIVEFYLANCYVQLGHYDMARKILSKITPTKEALKKQWLSLSRRLESLK